MYIYLPDELGSKWLRSFIFNVTQGVSFLLVFTCRLLYTKFFHRIPHNTLRNVTASAFYKRQSCYQEQYWPVAAVSPPKYRKTSFSQSVCLATMTMLSSHIRIHNMELLQKILLVTTNCVRENHSSSRHSVIYTNFFWTMSRVENVAFWYNNY